MKEDTSQGQSRTRKVVDGDGNVFYVAEDQRLGGGGQGDVYGTTDPDYAVKRAKNGGAGFNERLERIRHLPLPGNLHITFPVAILKDEPGFVMRRVGSESLAKYDVFKRGCCEYEEWVKTGNVKRRLQILASAAATLSRLHAAGLVYGDISAGNIRVDGRNNETAWLIDPDNLRFEVERNGHSVHTPGYAAPEVARGEDSRPTSDVWSFAVLAFRLLTGIDPFNGRLAQEEDEWGDDNPSGRAEFGLLPYVDDPTDDSNRAEQEGKPVGLPREWVFTPELRRLFDRTFCEGRTAPWKRPSMLAFAKALQTASDVSVVCEKCPNGRNSFFHGQCAICPWCDAELPPYCVASFGASHRIVLQGSENGRYGLPQRLFGPFYPETHSRTKYEVEVDLNQRKCKSVLGTRPFPEGLVFDFVGGNNGL